MMRIEQASSKHLELALPSSCRHSIYKLYSTDNIDSPTFAYRKTWQKIPKHQSAQYTLPRQVLGGKLP